MSELVDAIFGEDGVLSGRVKGYRPRVGQMEMAEAVEHALSEQKHLVVEAPTGTGKSFAAGLPAAANSIEEGRVIVYATANIALQEQLVYKDMPMIQEVVEQLVEVDENETEPVFKYGLIKGMSNYLCLAELQDSLRDDKLYGRWRSKLQAWAKETETGDKGELEEEPPKEVWTHVSTSSEDCLRNQCPFFDKCHIFKARERMQDAHVIVTNYHLLFIDRILRMSSEGKRGILPDYDVVIMDEAHEAPEIAMDFRGHQIGPSRWGRVSGAIRRAAEEGHKDAEMLHRRIEMSTEKMMSTFEEWVHDGAILDFPFGDDFHLVQTFDDCSKFLRSESYRIEEKGDMSDMATRLKVSRLRSLADSTKKLSYDIEILAYGLVKEKVSRGFKINFGGKKEGEEEFEEVLNPGSVGNIGVFPEHHVYYFEKNSRGRTIVSCKVLDAAGFLQEAIFEPKVAIVTSATLSAKGSLDFITDQMGLEKDDFVPLIVGTPFKGSNVLVMVPPVDDFPEPNESDFTDCCAQAVIQLLSNMKSGGMMCLFTSYRNLNAVEELAKRDSEFRQQVRILVQGQMGKRQIVREFMEAHEAGEKALILATASFWQGVDIPGQALSVVVIDKIPFVPPDDPVLWYLEKTTGNAAFHRYSVPKAIIALKQGMGRLIRREEDYGAVLILDTRIHKKRYGKSIESAFPAGCFFTDDFNHVIDFLEEKGAESQAG